MIYSIETRIKAMREALKDAPKNSRESRFYFQGVEDALNFIQHGVNPIDDPAAHPVLNGSFDK